VRPTDFGINNQRAVSGTQGSSAPRKQRLADQEESHRDRHSLTGAAAESDSGDDWHDEEDQDHVWGISGEGSKRSLNAMNDAASAMAESPTAGGQASESSPARKAALKAKDPKTPEGKLKTRKDAVPSPSPRDMEVDSPTRNDIVTPPLSLFNHQPFCTNQLCLDSS